MSYLLHLKNDLNNVHLYIIYYKGIHKEVERAVGNVLVVLILSRTVQIN